MATPIQWISLTASYGYLGFSTSTEDTSPRVRPLTGLGETLDFGVARVGGVLDWRTSPGYPGAIGHFCAGRWLSHCSRWRH